MATRTKYRPAWIRVTREPAKLPKVGCKIQGPHDVFGVLGDRASREVVEVFYLLTLSNSNSIINLHEVHRGSVTECTVSAREVFQRAILDNAIGIIVAHNHPTGTTTPSAEDKTLTRQLREAGRLLDIPLLDHVILGSDFYSFAQGGDLA